jgi:hypothetical protein
MFANIDVEGCRFGLFGGDVSILKTWHIHPASDYPNPRSHTGDGIEGM